jgi:hypothetical protein
MMVMAKRNAASRACGGELHFHYVEETDILWVSWKR